MVVCKSCETCKDHEKLQQAVGYLATLLAIFNKSDETGDEIIPGEFIEDIETFIQGVDFQ